MQHPAWRDWMAGLAILRSEHYLGGQTKAVCRKSSKQWKRAENSPSNVYRVSLFKMQCYLQTWLSCAVQLSLSYIINSALNIKVHVNVTMAWSVGSLGKRVGLGLMKFSFKVWLLWQKKYSIGVDQPKAENPFPSKVKIAEGDHFMFLSKTLQF